MEGVSLLVVVWSSSQTELAHLWSWGVMVLLERWLGGERGRWRGVMVLGGILGDCGEQEGGGKRQIITAHIVRRSHPLPFFCRDS